MGYHGTEKRVIQFDCFRCQGQLERDVVTQFDSLVFACALPAT